MSVPSIKFLRSGTAHNRPSTTGMSEGELALNINSVSAGLYFIDDTGSLIKVGPVEVSSSAPNSAAEGEEGNTVGELWFDENDDTLKIWHESSWKNVVPPPTGYTGSVTEGSTTFTIVDGIITAVSS